MAASALRSASRRRRVSQPLWARRLRMALELMHTGAAPAGLFTAANRDVGPAGSLDPGSLTDPCGRRSRYGPLHSSEPPEGLPEVVPVLDVTLELGDLDAGRGAVRRGLVLVREVEPRGYRS